MITKMLITEISQVSTNHRARIPVAVLPPELYKKEMWSFSLGHPVYKVAYYIMIKHMLNVTL